MFRSLGHPSVLKRPRRKFGRAVGAMAAFVHRRLAFGDGGDVKKK